MEDTTNLLALQAQLEQELHDTFIGLSVNHTIKKLIQARQSAKLQKLRKDYRIPEKR